MSIEWSFTLAVLLLLGNAFFVGAEFGLVSARRSAIELRARNGSRTARTTLGAMEQLSLMLAGAQLGITLCSLGLGAVGEPLIAHIIEPILHDAGVADYWLHPISLAVALVVMTYFHVVIGEMVPKNLALAGPERTALLLSPPLVIVVRLLHPVVSGLNHIANRFIRATGIEPAAEIASSFTSDEVAGFVEESRREGLISEDEGVLLSGALRFDERSIKTILLPVGDAVLATTKTTPEEIEELAVRTGFSRFPIQDSQGKLVGYMHLKDALAIEGDERRRPVQSKRMRPLGVVRASATLRDALNDMRQRGAHLAQVVNQRGRLLGVVALEDILEELVGEIRDESQKVGKVARTTGKREPAL